MKRFYIKDTTIGKDKFIYFKTIKDLVKYFEQLIPRAFGISRNEYVQNLIDLGHGYDDVDGVMLTRILSEQFNIGIVTISGKHVRTDIHISTSFLKEEYGD